MSEGIIIKIRKASLLKCGSLFLQIIVSYWFKTMLYFTIQHSCKTIISNKYFIFKCFSAKETDDSSGNYILKAVTEGVSYDCLRTRLDMPCCKDAYGMVDMAAVAPVWNIIYSLGLLMRIGDSVILVQGAAAATKMKSIFYCRSNQRIVFTGFCMARNIVF